MKIGRKAKHVMSGGGERDAMMAALIRSHRAEIVARVRTSIAARCAPRPVPADPTAGVPLFLDQLVERMSDEAAASGELATAAARHGRYMLERGFSVAQVVRQYGDVCEVVTELARERSLPIPTGEFLTLNRCLDTAIAEAVCEYERQRDRTVSRAETERLGCLAHELRNKLNGAMMSFDTLKRSGSTLDGGTGAVLGRSLCGLRELIDRALTQVRLDSGVAHRERVRLRKLVDEMEALASLEAAKREVTLSVSCADKAAEVEVDRHLLGSAVSNIVHNALKFTRPHGRVAIAARVAEGRVLIDVEDECGGLPGAAIAALFRAFEQRSTDRSGLGLGLVITRRGVEANGGVVRVQNRPGSGCTFTVDLPLARAQA